MKQDVDEVVTRVPVAKNLDFYCHSQKKQRPVQPGIFADGGPDVAGKVVPDRGQAEFPRAAGRGKRDIVKYKSVVYGIGIGDPCHNQNNKN